MDGSLNNSSNNSSSAAAASNGDPFAPLPAHLLRFISTFLANEDAARTAAISRRWAEIWPLARKVVLDERAFTDDEKRRLLLLDGRRSLADGILLTGRRAFLDFANRFATHSQEHCLESFSLRLSRPQEHIPVVRHCLQTAIKSPIKELELDFSDGDFVGHVELMREVDELRDTLHTLRLSGCCVDAPMLGSFTALRVISIARVRATQRAITTLLAHCRCLEDLSLIALRALEAINIVDRDGVLRRLTIDDCRHISYGVAVNAPRLVFFKYSGYLRPFTLEVWGVEEVELDFGLETAFDDEAGDLLSNVLLRLGNARQLVVCNYLTQVIASGEEPFQLPATIDNLSHLILKTALHRDELPGIALLLRSYPQLESLTIQTGDQRSLEGFEYPYNPVLDGREFWESPILQNIPCMQSHLKFVRIQGFRGTEKELHVLRYVLGRAMVLQEVIINVSKEMPVGEDVINALLGFARASPAVEIIIS